MGLLGVHKSLSNAYPSLPNNVKNNNCFLCELISLSVTYNINLSIQELKLSSLSLNSVNCPICCPMQTRGLTGFETLPSIIKKINTTRNY